MRATRNSAIWRAPNSASRPPNLYSLIETAKANGIEPYAYLRSIFTDLPRATSVEQIEALLPAPDGDGNLAIAS